MVEIIVGSEKPKIQESGLAPLTSENRMYRYFRRLYKAEWSRFRRIYWVEKARFNRFRLRLVTDLDRENKGEDKLIGIYQGEIDLDVIRLAIATASVGQILTGVRWELYADFELTELLEQGRHDHFDLVGRADPDRLHSLIQSEKIDLDLSPHAWDFDGIIAAHRCPNCLVGFCAEPVCFFPEWFYCEKCKFNNYTFGGDMKGIEAKIRDQAWSVIFKLSHTGDFHPADVPEEAMLMSLFVDAVATPLMCFAIVNKNVFVARWHPEHGSDINFNAALKALYKRSILPLLKIERLRELFKQMIEHHDRNWDKLVGRKMPVKFDGEISEAQYRQHLFEQDEEFLSKTLQEVDLLARADQLFVSPKTMDDWKFEGEMARAAEILPLTIEGLIEFTGRLLDEGGVS